MATTPKPSPSAPDLTTSAFLTAEEAAGLLRVDVRTVRRWCIDGQVAHANRLGRQWRIPRVELERFLGVTLAHLTGGLS